MTTYTIVSEHKLGARVKFNSKFCGAGEGVIVGITLTEDSSMHYIILEDSGEAIGGVLPIDIIGSLRQQSPNTASAS